MDKKQSLTPLTSFKSIYFHEFNTFRTLQVFSKCPTKGVRRKIWRFSSISRIYSGENKYCQNIQIHAPKLLFYAEDLYQFSQRLVCK
jgi:hypothetical protein